MIYRYIKPSPALNEYVKDYLIAHFIFDKDQAIPIKAFAPRPEQAITFLPKGNLIMHNLISNEEKRAPSASFCGQQISRYNFHVSTEYLMLRVNFHPGALYRLFRIPLHLFNDTWFDAATVVNQEITHVNERLLNSADYPAMIRIVEDYLLLKTRNFKLDAHPLDQVAAHMLVNPESLKMDWLASQACLCQRQFHRKFRERIGVSPKLYSRIIRFFNAYKYKEANPMKDWLSVAILFNYTDYQHMAKEFKEFTNVLPHLWVSQDTQSPERILQLQ